MAEDELIEDNLDNTDVLEFKENTEIEGEYFETELKDEKMTKRNSVDIYKSPGAAVRELLSNGVTATLEAEESGDLPQENGEILVKLVEEDGRWKLIIQDNGIGMSEKRLRILSSLGDSTSGSTGDRTGKFGIGFYSAYKIASVSGNVIVQTRSRKTGESHYCRWKIDGGKSIEGVEPDLGEYDYGTKIEIYVKEEISREELDSWIRKHAAAARRPVKYVQEWADNVDSEIFERTDMVEEYGTDIPFFSATTDYFDVVFSADSETERYILDVSADAAGVFDSYPWDCAIRFKTEDHVVVKTENHSVLDDEPIPEDSNIGEKVIDSDQYDGMPKSKKEEFIPRRKLSDKAVYTPAPAGTRDTIAELQQFCEWLDDEIGSWLNTCVEEILEKDIPSECSITELNFLYSLFEGCHRTVKIKNRIRSIQDSFVHTSKVEDIEKIVGYTVNVEDSTFNNLSIKVQSKSEYGTRKYPVMELEEFANDNNAVIYMGVSLNDRKKKVVKKHYENAIFVKVDKADKYELYEPLGWKKIKEINKSFVDNLKISTQQKEKYKNILEKSSTSRSTRTGKITIRFGIGRETKKISVDDLKQKLRANKRIASRELEKLVLFPDSGGRNVSDYYEVGGKHIAVARCSEQQHNHLKNYEEVCEYTEYRRESLTKRVMTSEGILTGEELLGLEDKSVYVTMIGERAESMINRKDYSTQFIGSVLSKFKSFVGRNIGKGDSIHIFVQPSLEEKLRPVLAELDNSKMLLLDNTVQKEPDWPNKTVHIDMTTYIGILRILEENPDESSDLIQFLSRSKFNFNEYSEAGIEALIEGLSSRNQ